MISPYWKVILDGYYDHEAGDVYTSDGEFIGTWSIVDDVFYTFTPEGAERFLLFEPHLGILCTRIDEWHRARQFKGSLM